MKEAISTTQETTTVFISLLEAEPDTHLRCLPESKLLWDELNGSMFIFLLISKKSRHKAPVEEDILDYHE